MENGGRFSGPSSAPRHHLALLSSVSAFLYCRNSSVIWWANLKAGVLKVLMCQFRNLASNLGPDKKNGNIKHVCVQSESIHGCITAEKLNLKRNVSLVSFCDMFAVDASSFK